MGLLDWLKPKKEIQQIPEKTPEKISEPSAEQTIEEVVPEPKKKTGRPIGLMKNASSQSHAKAMSTYAETHVSDETGDDQLNHGMRMEIVKRIAWYWKDAEIARYFAKEYNRTITDRTVNRYRHDEKWMPLIEREQELYNSLIMRVPLANKRKRLDEFQRQYEQIGELNNKESRKEAREILRECRDEIERKIAGDISINFNQVNHNEFRQMTDEDLQKEKMKTIEQLEKVRKLKLLTGANDVIQEVSAEEIKES